MKTKLWKALLIGFFMIMVMSFVCMDTNAQLASWPVAISDPYASIFASFSALPLIGGTFGVTSLFGAPGSFLFPSYSYYSLFDFDDYWYWQPYSYDFYSYYPYAYSYDYYLPYFGVTSAYFPIYTESPWWASALAFL